MKQISILIALLLSLHLNAQQLTLQEAINLSLKNSFDIRIAKNAVDISKTNNNRGIAGGLPIVSGTFSEQESITNLSQNLNTGTVINRNGATSNTINAGVTGSILLYNGNRVVATKKRLEQLEKQSEQLLNAQIQQTIASVMIRYFDIVRQQSFMRTLLQSIELSNKQLELVQVKQSLGLANNADLFQSQIDVNTKKQDIRLQQMIIDQAKTDLQNLLNLPPDSAITITDTIGIDQKIELPAILLSIHKNPEVISLDQQIRINQLIEKETRAQRFPSLRANTGLNYGRTQNSAGQLLLNQSYGPFVGVGLTVPIYNGTVNKRQEKIAKINTKNATLQKESMVQDFETAATKTFQSYSSGIQQFELQQNTYQLSKQLVDLSLQRFELGAATIIEIREAQKSFEEAGYRLVNISYSTKIAEIELKRLSNQRIITYS